MTNVSPTAAAQALDGMTTPTNTLGFVSAHTGSPGTTGANEASGGGYARVACSWNAANTSTGTKTNSSSLSITTNGTTPITSLGTFSASTAGTFGLGLALASSITATTITVAPGALSISGS